MFQFSLKLKKGELNRKMKPRIEEKMLILPALYIIKRKGKATTSDLINELTIFFNPSGEDNEILSGRSDTKFSQKVRNLVSHRENNGMKEYTTFEDGVYSITNQGEAYLNTRIGELDYLFSQNFKYDDVIETVDNITDEKKKVLLYDETLVSEGGINTKPSKVRERSKLLRDKANEHYSLPDGRILCEVCGFDFSTVYGEWGKGFTEIHHEKPICQYDENGTEVFISEAIKYVKPLCANCHRMIHRKKNHAITIDELKKIIRKK